MPGMNGTGPLGLGSRTGRALGLCGENRSMGRSSRFFRCGCNRYYGFGNNHSDPDANSRKALNARKILLQEQLSAVNEQLERQE